MIIKNANDYQSLIESIERYVKSSMSSSEADIDGSIIDVINGVAILIGKANDKRAIEDNDILLLLGAENISKVGTLLGDVRKYLESSDIVGYAKLLLDVVNLYKGYSSGPLKGLLESSATNINSIAPDMSEGRSGVNQPASPTGGEVIFEEEPTGLLETNRTPEEDLSSFYVSEGGEFSTSSIFYGPFDSNLKATVFSALIHDPGFGEELSIMRGDILTKIHKNNRTNNFSLNQARDTGSASIKNQILKGRIEHASLKNNGISLELFTSGDIFDAFVEFVGKSFYEKDNKEEISLEDLRKWIETDEVLLFPLFYAKRSGVSSQAEFDKAIPKGNVIKTPKIEVTPKAPPKYNLNEVAATPAIEISSAVSSAESFQPSITSKDNTDVLSSSSITEFFNKIKSEIILFDKINNEKITDSSFDKLGELFRSIAKKDLDIKKALREFREKNKLDLTPGINYEWEFRSGFSILEKISSDEEVVKSLASIIGRLVVNKLLTSEKRTLNFRVSRTVRGYVENRGIKSADAADIGNVISTVEDEVMRNVYRIVEKEIRKNIGIFLGSSGFFNQDISALADKILGLEINISTIISIKTQEFFSNKDRVLESQKYYMAKCGVCNQMTQIPQEYQKLINSFSSEMKQYSFFKKDGSLITELELRGTDSERMYDLSPGVSLILSDYLKTASRKSTKGLAKKQYTWEEVNLMISDPVSSGANSAESVEQNVIGLIIRNDILNNHFDAMPSGRKGIFANKSLCAGSLLNLRDDIKAFEPTKKFLAEQQNFECKAAVASSYDSPSDSPKYFKSAYVAANGNVAGKKEVDSYFNTGFRFSKNQVRCPCHIDSNSDAIRIAKEKREYKEIFDIIAIPNIPSSVAKLVYDKFKPQMESLRPTSIYHPPTTPDGRLAENIPEAGYVICGKKVSLSLFDKDPSSLNYIRSVLSKGLMDGGTKKLVSMVNLLIGYGVEMNDLRPHIEAVMSSGLVTTSAKRKTLKELFSQSKISIAQDLSSDSSALILRDIGLTCEHGHKFTIGQSWGFAKTHLAIVPQGRVKTNRISGLITKTVSLNNMIELAQSDSTKAMNLMMSKPSEGNPGFGVFKKVSEENDLRDYKQPAEAENYEELLNLIKNKRLYYKSDDGSTYIISDDISSGALVSSPWKADSVTLIPQSTYDVNLYAGSMQSLSQGPEQGGEEDVEDTSGNDYGDYRGDYQEDEEDEEDEQSNFLINTYSDLKFANILFSDMGTEVHKLNALSVGSLYEEISKISEGHKELSQSFISKLVVAIRQIKIWSNLAADAQTDFLKKPSSVPFSAIRDEEGYDKLKSAEKVKYFSKRVEDRKNSLKEGVKDTLSELMTSLGMSIAPEEIEEKTKSFFNSYRVFDLIEGSVSQDKFMSLAGIAQYYKDFSTPFIANLSIGEAHRSIIKSLAEALNKNLPSLLGIDGTAPDSDTSSRLSEVSAVLAEYLMSPYEMSSYRTLSENALVDYSGRALVFSFGLDMIKNIKDFFTKYLYNRESELYIGPYGGESMRGVEIINTLLSTEVVNGTSTPKIFLMEDSEFEKNLNEMRAEFELMYNLDEDRLIKNYLLGKGVGPVNLPDDDNEEDTKKACIQFILVISRFSKALSIACNSIDSISSESAGKPMGSPSIKKAAMVLDVVAEQIIKQRDPVNFERNKKRMFENRTLYGDKGSLFSTNSVGIARINLSPTNESLAPMMSEGFKFKTYEISSTVLTGVDPNTTRIDLELIVLREILVSKKDINEEGTKLYLSIVPFSTKITQNMIKRNIDILNNDEGISFDPKEVKIILGNQQLEEFASRYLSGISGVDKSRLVIIDSKHKIVTSKKLDDSAIKKILESNSQFEIRISKLEESSKVWPPPNNLIFDGLNMPGFEKYMKTESQQDLSLVSSVDDYYKNSSYSSDHHRFIANIENFTISKTSKSPETSSSFGMIIPLKSAGESALYNQIANTSEKINAKKVKDMISVSDAKIYIRSESGRRINISWAFKSLDPQIINEDGDLRHKLVQSGVVQKMDHINRSMNSLYQKLASNSQGFFETISKINSCQKISFSNNESFFETLFSPLSPVIKISVDIESGSSRASLNMNNINFALSKPLYEEMNFSKEDLLSNLVMLTDYYNASQILNFTYLDLRPTLVTASSTDLRKGRADRSLAISLLDPYSLWAIVSNPAMTTRFGGPIDPDYIDDYKSFIIQTFGLEDIASGVIKKTGLKPSSFKVEDLFDLAGFYNRYYKKNNDEADQPLINFAKLFNLNIDMNVYNKLGTANTYINGYPICTNPSSGLKEVVESAETSNIVVDSSSYIEHPYRFESSLSSLTDSLLNDLKKKIDKNKDNLIREIKKDLSADISEINKSNLSAGEKKSKIKELVSNEYESRKAELLSKADPVVSARERNRQLESGEITLSIDELFSLATGSGIIRKDSPFSWSDYRALIREIQRSMRRVVANLQGSKTKTASKTISWRKIAQTATDDQGTMIRSLYHEWWKDYLNIMAKLAS